MRRVLLLIVLLIGAIVPAGRAASAGEAGSITIVGKRTSFADVRFHSEVVLDESSTKLSSAGELAGWVIHPIDRSAEYGKGDIAGAYMLDDVAPTDAEYGPHLFTVNLTEVTIPAGLYRVYLLADGPAEVRIPLISGEGTTIRPTKRTQARWTAAELLQAAPRVVRGSISQPLEVKDDSLTFASLYLYSSEGATVQDVASCLRDQAEEAPPPGPSCEGGGWAGYVIHANQDYVFNLNTVYPPGSIEAGRYFTYAKATATTVDRVMGVGVTIDLRGV